MGDITTDNKEIKRIIRYCFKNLYSTQMDELKEMDSFLGRYCLSKLNKDQLNNPNRSIFPK